MGFLAAAVTAFAVFVWTKSYLFAFGALIITVVASLIYLTGETSDLPGTAGDNDKNVPT